MYLILVSLVLLGVEVVAQEASLACKQLRSNQLAEVHLVYEKLRPIGVFMKDPGEDFYEEADVKIQVVRPVSEEGYDSFLAKPNIDDESVDWDQMKTCYLEAGTQWYFQLDRGRRQFQVTFAPFFLKSKETCVTPRFPPQTYRLKCWRP